MKDYYLTREDERFIRALIDGKSQYEAYCLAYPNTKGKSRSTIDVLASKKLRNSKIKIRYEKLLQDEYDNRNIDRNWLVKKAKAIVDGSEDGKTKDADKIRALEFIAKITGLDTPDDD